MLRLPCTFVSYSIAAAVLRGEEHPSNLGMNYLCVKRGKQMTGDDIGRVFRDQLAVASAAQARPIRLNISDWRQIVALFSKERLRNQDVEERLEGSSIVDMQSVHTSKTADRVYGTTSKDHPYVTAAEIFLYHKASRELQHLIFGLPTDGTLPATTLKPPCHRSVADGNAPATVACNSIVPIHIDEQYPNPANLRQRQYNSFFPLCALFHFVH
jgi:hypothetical protein